MSKSYVSLAASIFVALSGWAAHFSSWQELAEVSTFFGALGTIGAVVIAWLGESPIRPKWDGSERRDGR